MIADNTAEEHAAMALEALTKELRRDVPGPSFVAALIRTLIRAEIALAKPDILRSAGVVVKP